MKKNKTTIILVLFFFIGLAILLYPSISNYWNSLHQSKAISHYVEAVANNIQVPYRNYTREEVSKYSPFDLVSNREVLNKIDSAVMSKMTKYVEHLSKEKEFPIIIKAVVTGAAKPNKDQLTEMNRTAALIQKKESEQRNKEMEIVRAEAETARAQADKAYQNAMGLSSEQFIQLKYIEMIDKKQGANIDVMIGGANPMWNIRR